MVDPPQAERFADCPREINTLYSFDVHFGGGSSDFPECNTATISSGMIEQASLFGNAIILMKGHANGQELTWEFRRLVVRRGLLTQKGGKYYRKDGSEFNMNDMKQILAMIEQAKTGGEPVPMMNRQTMSMDAYMKMLLNLSNQRAASVRRAVLDYAKKHGYRLDPSQIKSAGLGGTEPLDVFPREGDNEAGRIIGASRFASSRCRPRRSRRSSSSANQQEPAIG